jgi:hypothetical protein
LYHHTTSFVYSHAYLVVSSRRPHITNCHGFQLAASINSEREIAILMLMDEKDVMYPLNNYPQIREFAALLRFYSRSNSITIGLSIRLCCKDSQRCAVRPETT